MRIGSVIIFHLSKLCKAKFSILCAVIFLVCRGNSKLITLGSERVKKLGHRVRLFLFLVSTYPISMLPKWKSLGCH